MPTLTSVSRFRALAILVVGVALAGASCGGGVPRSTATLAPGVTPTPSPLIGGGGSSGNGGPEVTRGPGEATPAASTEAASPGLGERMLLAVQRLDGELAWRATLDLDGGKGTLADVWNVTVNLVLKRDPQGRNLVYAVGSSVVVDWTGPEARADEICPATRAHWSGDLASADAEGVSSLSSQTPVAYGVIGEQAHSLRLEITIPGPAYGDRGCHYPDVTLTCPVNGVQTLWQETLDDPARLDYSCEDASPDAQAQYYRVNAVGLLEEGRPTP